jgi:hypothetical protein
LGEVEEKGRRGADVGVRFRYRGLTVSLCRKRLISHDDNRHTKVSPTINDFTAQQIQFVFMK